MLKIPQVMSKYIIYINNIHNIQIFSFGMKSKSNYTVGSNGIPI